MEEVELKKKVLERLILNALTIDNDELEGTLVIDLYNDINLCASDNNGIVEPPLTPEQINTLFHFNDPNVSQSVRDAIDNAVNNAGDIDDTSNLNNYNRGEQPDVSTGDTTSEDGGTTSGPAAENYGYDYSAAANPEYQRIENAFHNYNNIKIPDDAKIDDIVQAILNDKEPSGLNRAIIEFAQPCIREENGVDFQFLVKPGQSLTQDTIIAKATINGISKPIRSIFSSGTVLANESGTDFKHLYNGYGANRHIIIEDFEYCGEAPEINTDLIDQVNDKFKNNAYLYQLITDNIAECVLPSILLNRYTEYRYKWLALIKVRDPRPNGRELYGKYLDDIVNPLREGYQNDMKSLASEDRIKNCNGNAKKLKSAGQEILNRRDLYAEQMIWCYEKARLSIDKSEYDPEYNDCKYLAVDKDIDEGERETHTQIGDTDYNNYYLALLSKVNITTENIWTQKYYDLLKGIIENRITLEKYNITDIINEFNTQFKNKVNKRYKNPWSDIDVMMKSKKGEGTMTDVITWISNAGGGMPKTTVKDILNLLTTMKNNGSSTASVINLVSNSTSTSGGGSSDPYAYLTYQQLANIYMFVYNYKAKKVTASEAVAFAAKPQEGQLHPLYKLVLEEWNKIQTFWSEAIAEYRKTSIDDCINAIKEIPEKIEQYHHWPVLSYFQTSYDVYEHFLFENLTEVIAPEEDEDLGSYVDANIPIIPDSMEAPPEQPLESLNDNQIDPSEPTIKDYAYWVRYFALATVISLPYLNCGLDIPPFVMMIPLPCIFICVGCVYIKILDIVIVFGISIRGMWIWPIILFVNVGNMTASILTPLIAMVKSMISKISAKINSLAEMPITSIALGFINMIEMDNARLRKENKQLDVYINQIKIKKVKNMEKIKKVSLKAMNPTANLKQQVVDPMSAIYTKDKKDASKK